MIEANPLLNPLPPLARPASAGIAELRARLMVRFACELLGIDPQAAGEEVRLPISVTEFEAALRRRYGATHPTLVYRTDSTLERARLERRDFPQVPRVILRRGAPPRGARLTPLLPPGGPSGHMTHRPPGPDAAPRAAPGACAPPYAPLRG